MATEYLSGGDALEAKLEEIARKMNAGAVEVGFDSEAKYADGTLVALVAWWNEFGRQIKLKNGDTRFQPPRPFFRNMIAKDSPSWPGLLAAGLKYNNFDGKLTLKQVGDHIRGKLIQSINELTSPALAESTVESKGFDKPLIDTKKMVDSPVVNLVD
jgi:hypothetical protein